MAPEMVVSGCYDDKADLWSVGVILYGGWWVGKNGIGGVYSCGG